MKKNQNNLCQIIMITSTSISTNMMWVFLTNVCNGCFKIYIFDVQARNVMLFWPYLCSVQTEMFNCMTFIFLKNENEQSALYNVERENSNRKGKYAKTKLELKLWTILIIVCFCAYWATWGHQSCMTYHIPPFVFFNSTIWNWSHLLKCLDQPSG